MKLRKLALLLLPELCVLPELCLLFLAVSHLHAQAITPPVAAVNFGSVNTCGDNTAAGPCFATQTLSWKVTQSGTVGKPMVLTLGVPNLDFTLSGGTCNGSVTAGSNCTVVVKFTPRFAGLRIGAAQVVDTSGKVLATTFMHGVGIGPQAAITTGKPTVLVSTASGYIPNSGIAVDGSGNVLFSAGGSPHTGTPGVVMEYPSAGGELLTAATGFSVPQGLAVDGAGNLYVTDTGTNKVVEVPHGCAASSCYITLDGGFFTPYGVAVDGAGTVYVADTGNNRVLAMPSGCITGTCAHAIGSGLNYPYSVAVDGAGTVVIADVLNQRVVRVLAGGQQATMAANLGTAYGVALDGGDDILITDFAHDQVVEEPFAGGNLRTLTTLQNPPVAIAVDGSGNIFYTNSNSSAALSELRMNSLPLYTFSTTAVGNSSGDSPQNYTVQNIGNAPLSLSSVSVGPAGDFAQVPGYEFGPVNCQPGLTLSPGIICYLGLSFTPQVNGPLNGSAVLTDNSLNTTDATQGIALAGAGGPPQVIDFSSGFANAYTTTLLNGGATITANTLQLTDGGNYESRSAFFTTPIGVSTFFATFDFVLRGKTTESPDGDGFTFVLQSDGPNALGSAGGGLGYGVPGVGLAGPKIPNSIALKFDLHDNAGEGNSSVGLFVNGAAPTVPALSFKDKNHFNLHSGHPYTVFLVYDGTTLTLGLLDKVNFDAVDIPYPIDIPATLGGTTAFAGFTGSTGALTAVQNILDFSINSTGCCTSGTPQFSAFDSIGDFRFNGDANIVGGALQLTHGTPQEISAVWYPTPVPVNRFTSDFDFELTRGDGEGFTFALQGVGTRAVGSAGGGLGFGPDPVGGGDNAIAHSVAVKFDLHSEGGEGSNSTGVYVGGVSPTTPATDLTSSGINLHSGHKFHARLSYDGTNLAVNLTDLSQFAVFSASYPVAIPAAIGATQAYAGFTAATGAVADTVKILNWSMSYY